MEKDIMKFETVLPVNFDGTFRFTNWTDEDFTGRYGSKDYLFPAGTTSPILMTDHTPLEIQQIRKKFAKDLAEREFFKSDKYKKFTSYERNADGTPRLNSSLHAIAYTMDDLAPMIQKCLEPLPAGQVIVRESPKAKLEETLSRDEEGNLNTEAIDKKVSLKEKARGK